MLIQRFHTTTHPTIVLHSARVEPNTQHPTINGTEDSTVVRRIEYRIKFKARFIL